MEAANAQMREKLNVLVKAVTENISVSTKERLEDLNGRLDKWRQKAETDGIDLTCSVNPLTAEDFNPPLNFSSPGGPSIKTDGDI